MGDRKRGDEKRGDRKIRFVCVCLLCISASLPCPPFSHPPFSVLPRSHSRCLAWRARVGRRAAWGISRARICGIFPRSFRVNSSSPQISAILVGRFTRTKMVVSAIIRKAPAKTARKNVNTPGSRNSLAPPARRVCHLRAAGRVSSAAGRGAA